MNTNYRPKYRPCDSYTGCDIVKNDLKFFYYKCRQFIIWKTNVFIDVEIIGVMTIFMDTIMTSFPQVGANILRH